MRVTGGREGRENGRFIVRSILSCLNVEDTFLPVERQRLSNGLRTRYSVRLRSRRSAPCVFDYRATSLQRRYGPRQLAPIENIDIAAEVSYSLEKRCAANTDRFYAYAVNFVKAQPNPHDF